ncbi:MAG: terminase small subunit [Nitrosospira sp.]|nr:terminase small subunit [Nitrosospira sp.]
MKKPSASGLTLKQQRFANEYCIDLNATAAYRRAGYNARGDAAEACASRLLSNAKVQRAVQEKEKIAAKRLEVTSENILRETSALAFSDIRKLFNPDGSPKSIHELDDATAAAISSIEIGQMMSEGRMTGRICKIKLWDKNSAQERLFKHLRLFDKSSRKQSLQRIEIGFVSGTGEVVDYSEPGIWKVEAPRCKNVVLPITAKSLNRGRK